MSEEGETRKWGVPESLGYVTAMVVSAVVLAILAGTLTAIAVATYEVIGGWIR